MVVMVFSMLGYRYMTLTRKLAALALLLPIFFAAIMPMVALAQGGGLKTIVPPNCQGAGAAENCGACDIAILAQNVINDGIFFAIVVSAVFIAWAGWQYMTAEGQPYKIKAAKKMFRNIVIGLLLIVGAWLLVDVLLNTLTGSSGLQWNRIC
jgi:hypothetical protein